MIIGSTTRRDLLSTSLYSGCLAIGGKNGIDNLCPFGGRHKSVSIMLLPRVGMIVVGDELKVIVMCVGNLIDINWSILKLHYFHTTCVETIEQKEKRLEEKEKIRENP